MQKVMRANQRKKYKWGSEVKETNLKKKKKSQKNKTKEEIRCKGKAWQGVVKNFKQKKRRVSTQVYTGFIHHKFYPTRLWYSCAILYANLTVIFMRLFSLLRKKARCN